MEHGNVQSYISGLIRRLFQIKENKKDFISSLLMLRLKFKTVVSFILVLFLIETRTTALSF